MFQTINIRDYRLANLALGLLLLISIVAEADQEYPTAERLPISEKIHGIEIADPYRWMEDSHDSKLADWVNAQSSMTEEFVAGPHYEQSRERIQELGSYDLGFAAKRRAGKLFYMLRPKNGARVELRQREGPDSRVLVRSSDVPDKDTIDIFIGGKGFSPSHWPDRAGNMLAYAYTDGSASFTRWRILDTDSGLHLPDVIEGVRFGFGGAEWSATGDGFYYSRFRTLRSPDATETKAEPAGLYFHRLGTAQTDDIAIISQASGDRFLYGPRVTTEGNLLVVAKQEGTAPLNSHLVFDLVDGDAEPVSIFADTNSRSIYLGNNKTRLYFQTNLDAPNGRVVAIDILNPGNIVEVIAESDLPMLAGSNVGGDVLGYFGGYFVLGYLQDGSSHIRVFDDKGGFKTTLELPDGSSVWGNLDNVPGHTRVTTTLLNPFSPGHVISFDASNGAIVDEMTANVPLDANDFVAKRVFYESLDGTRIPMSVVHKNGIALDGENPTLIYGYGMHKWVSLLFYQAHIVHWLELGGVYAMPAIRGGGEYGDEWHAAGIKTDRQNAVDDFVAAGKWLIDAGYTSSKKLAANGSSASGALAGIIPLRHGDVFAAATIDYPIADLVRAPMYGNGALLVDEYGALSDPAEGRALIQQSPYHQVKTDFCYMPTLVMVGENDKVALPFHGYKITASMQHAQNCDNPIQLKLMRGTGHNYGTSAELNAENTAVQIAFLRKALDF